MRFKPNTPPSLINPTPLHLEHAIILRLPHLLHIPKELNIQRIHSYTAHINQNAQIHNTQIAQASGN